VGEPFLTLILKSFRCAPTLSDLGDQKVFPHTPSQKIARIKNAYAFWETKNRKQINVLALFFPEKIFTSIRIS